MASSNHLIRCVLIVSVVLTRFQPSRAAELESSGESKQHVLENFIEESLAQIDGTGHFEENLAENVDTLAQFLNIGSDQSEDLQDAIAEAVNIRELLEDDAAYVDTTGPTTAATTSSHFVPPPRSPGLKGLFDPDEANPHIVHAKRSIDLEKFMDTTSTLLHTLPRYEQKFLQEVSQEVVSLEDSGREIDFDAIKPTTGVTPKGSPIRGLQRLAVSVWQRGTDVLDRFYQAPEFIMKAPVLGDYIRDLKKKCEPLYKTVKFLRHSVYLLKFMPFNPKKTNLKDASKADRHRIEEAKKMISDVGASALKALSFKVLARYARKAITEETTQEFITRAFYTILGNMLSIDKFDGGGFLRTGFKYVLNTFRVSCRFTNRKFLPSLGI